MDSDLMLSRLLEAARIHGEESEVDHEAGDLRDVLWLAWRRLTPAAQKEVYTQSEDVLSWLGEED